MIKQLFFMSCIVKQSELHKAMIALENCGVMKLEIKTILDDKPSLPITKHTTNAIHLTTAAKRQKVVDLLVSKGPITGSKIAKIVTFSMKNPTGFLKAMIKTNAIKQDLITKEYFV